MKQLLKPLMFMVLIGITACQKYSTSPQTVDQPPPQSSPGAPSPSGTDTGGGGSPRDIQKILVERIRSHLFSEIVRVTTGSDMPVPQLKSAAASMLKFYPSYTHLKPKTIAILKDMEERGGSLDIVETEILIKDRCVDMYGRERSATSPMNQLRGAICVNPNAIIDELGYSMPDSALIALILHEYAHHFGYEDKDYAFAVDIAEAIEADFEESMNQDRNPNVLIRPHF